MKPVEPPVVERGPVDKTFRPFDPDQAWLVPPSLDDWLPQEHIARFIADLVDEHLDLSAFYADYREGRGAPPFAGSRCCGTAASHPVASCAMTNPPLGWPFAVRRLR